MVQEFNLLRKTITIDKYKYGNEVDFIDLLVFKGDQFFIDRKFESHWFLTQRFVGGFNICFIRKKLK